MDGSLTTLGVILASWGYPQQMILAAGLGVAFANSISNACGGYISEKTAKIHSHMKREKALLIRRGLAKTIHMTRAEIDSLKRGLMDSLGTFLGALIPLGSVFLIAGVLGLYVGIIVPVVLYILLGIWMGLLSREHLLVSAFKTTIFALGVVVVTYYIGIMF